MFSLVQTFRITLYNRIFKKNSLARDFNFVLLAGVLSGRAPVRGTLCESILAAGLSPTMAAFSSGQHIRRISKRRGGDGQDGWVDSLRGLLYSRQFQQAASKERYLAKLLVRAF